MYVTYVMYLTYVMYVIYGVTHVVYDIGVMYVIYVMYVMRMTLSGTCLTTRSLTLTPSNHTTHDISHSTYKLLT